MNINETEDSQQEADELRMFVEKMIKTCEKIALVCPTVIVPRFAVVLFNGSNESINKGSLGTSTVWGTCKDGAKTKIMKVQPHLNFFCVLITPVQLQSVNGCVVVPQDCE